MQGFIEIYFIRTFSRKVWMLTVSPLVFAVWFHKLHKWLFTISLTQILLFEATHSEKLKLGYGQAVDMCPTPQPLKNPVSWFAKMNKWDRMIREMNN